MTNFQGIVIALLVAIAARTVANGHDIRDDWNSSERTVLVITVICSWAAVGVFSSNWIFG